MAKFLLLAWLSSPACLLAQVGLEVSWDPHDFVFHPGQEVLFEAASNDAQTPLTLSWLWSDGLSASGAQHSRTMPAPSVLSLRIEGRSSAQLLAVWQADFYVTNPLGSSQADAFISQPQGQTSVLKAGSSLVFTAASSLPEQRFFWQIPGLGLRSGDATWSLTTPAQLEGFFDVLLFGQNADGVFTPYPSTHSLYLYIENAPPDTVIAQPAPPVPPNTLLMVNEGDQVNFSATGDDPDNHLPLQFAWTVYREEEWQSFEGASLALTFSEPGYSEVWVASIDALGQTDPFPAMMGVWAKGPNTPPLVWALNSSATTASGAPVVLEAEGYDAEYDSMTFHWDLGDGRQLEGKRVEFTYPSAGAFPLSLTARDERGGVSRPYQLWMLVNNSAEALNMAPYADLDAPLIGAMYREGESITFHGSGFDPEGKPLSFYWDFDDGTIASGNSTAQHAYQLPEDNANEVFYPQVFVRDEEGMGCWWAAGTAIAVYRDQLPPDGIIISPQPQTQGDPYQAPRVILRPGESLQLQAGVRHGDPQTMTARWSFYHAEGQNFYVEGFHPAGLAYEDFPVAGFYEIMLSVRDAQGLEDPIPASVSLWVRDSSVPPEIWIQEPGWDGPYEFGEGFDLAASGYDEDGDAISFEWLLSDGRRLLGERIDHISFSRLGLQWVELSGRDSEGTAALTPRRRYLVILPRADEVNFDPPSILPTFPRNPALLGPPNSRFSFACEGRDSENLPLTYFWDFGNGATSNLQNPGDVLFPQPGFFEVRVFAGNSLGIWTPWPTTWQVYIYGDNIPPDGQILEPALREHSDFYQQRVIPVLTGAEIALKASIQDQDGDLPLEAAWWVDGQFYSSALSPPPLAFAEKGHHSAELYCWDGRGLQDPFSEFRHFHVIDPALKPQSYIADPYGELVVEPGQPVYFYGFGEDPNEWELSYSWQFEGGQPAVLAGAEAYPIVFPQESPAGSPYRVTFTACTPFAEDPSPAEIFITVKSFEDNDFEPNDSLSLAAELRPGQYSNLSLAPGSDNADYFVFTLAEQGKDLSLTLSAAQTGVALDAELYRRHDDGWLRIGLPARSFQSDAYHLPNLPAGTYALEVQPDQESRKRSGTLSYGIGLNTSQPSVYLPFLVEDGNLSSFLGLVNPNPEPAEMVLVGLDEQGRSVDSRTLTLPPFGRIFAPSLTFFGYENTLAKGRLVRWLKVASSKRLVGYVTAETRDHSQLVAIEGSSQLAKDLLVPHIAVKTEQWYTRAITVNAAEKPSPLQFLSAGNTTQIRENTAANGQTDFRFAELFPGSLPEWGQLADGQAAASLAGVELFGRVDGPKTLAGFELAPRRVGNPNFFHLERELVFAHIAADTANFWTGIALINQAQTENTVLMIAFDDAGRELQRQTLPMAPQSKMVNVVSALFPGLQGVSWLRVLGSGDLAGFELFGDHASTRICGFQAPTSLTDQLIFPHLSHRPDEWTGIALLNAGPEPSSLTLQVYDDSGNLLAERSELQPPFTKLVRTHQALFPEGLPSAARWLRVQSNNKTLTGFQLFGDFSATGALGERMAGILALTP